MNKLALVIALGCASVASAADKPAEKAAAKPTEAAPPLPPEVKKTTDAFAGKWNFEGSVSMPGAQPAKFKFVMDCKKIALGNGDECSMDTKVPNMGPMAQTCLIAFDPEGTGVHMMCVTSMGEVHDHKGKWTDDKTVVFEPYKATMGGKPITEDVTIKLADAKNFTMNSTTTMDDGSKMVFEGTGKKK